MATRRYAAVPLVGASVVSAWVPSCLWDANAATPECVAGLPRIQQYSALGRETSMLWTDGYKADPDAGLGQGISWAWDDALCDELLPRFDEDLWFAQLVTCETLRAAMTRGFASWSAHHPAINFHDVSNECNEIPLGEPGSKLYAQHPLDTTGVLGKGCTVAEVFVTAQMAPDAAADAAAAATVLRIRTDSSCCTATDSSCCFRSTSGVVNDPLHPVYDARRATLSFNSSICWYLDSTFCSAFHRLKALLGDDEAVLIGRILIFSLFAIVLLESMVTFYQLVRRHRRAANFEHAERHGKYSDEAAALYAYTLSKLAKSCSACALTVRGFLLITPILFYLQIFLPCWECFDFEVGATHEIGHLLGLAHPDEAQPVGKNLRLAERFAGDVEPSYNCSLPWQGVEVAPQDAEIGETVMQAFTQTPPEACIFLDDLDALNVLYPVCENRVVRPQCFKTRQLFGWVRLAAYVLLPTLILLIVVMAINSYCMRHHHQAQERMEKEHKQMAEHVAALKADIAKRKAEANKLHGSGLVREMVRHPMQARGILQRARMSRASCRESLGRWSLGRWSTIAEPSAPAAAPASIPEGAADSVEEDSHSAEARATRTTMHFYMPLSLTWKRKPQPSLQPRCAPGDQPGSARYLGPASPPRSRAQMAPAQTNTKPQPSLQPRCAPGDQPGSARYLGPASPPRSRAQMAPAQTNTGAGAIKIGAGAVPTGTIGTPQEPMRAARAPSNSPKVRGTMQPTGAAPAARNSSAQLPGVACAQQQRPGASCAGTPPAGRKTPPLQTGPARSTELKKESWSQDDKMVARPTRCPTRTPPAGRKTPPLQTGPARSTELKKESWSQDDKMVARPTRCPARKASVNHVARV